MKDDEKRAPQGLIDSQDRIAQDLACVKCRQNLRSRQLNDDCPACGHPILDSVFGDYLIRQTTTSVMRLADAVRVVVYGSAVLAGLIALALISGVTGARDFGRAMDTAFDLLLAGGLIFPLVAIVGAILLRPPRPAAYYKAHYLNPRRLRRWALVLAPLLAVAATGTYYNSAVMVDLGKVLWVVIPPAVFLRRVERLMCDLPNFRLARLAFGVFVGAVLFGVACFAVMLLQMASLTDPDYEGALVGVTLITLVGGLALVIVGFNLLLRVRWALTEAAR
jgi:hypothetical protein